MSEDSWPTPEALERAQVALALLGTSRSPTATGCAWCGCSHSPSWRASPWSWPRGPHAYLCDDCWRRWRSARCHAGSPWRPQLAAEAQGLELAPLEGLDPVPSFLESDPPDRRGTLERFAYLEDRPC